MNQPTPLQRLVSALEGNTRKLRAMEVKKYTRKAKIDTQAQWVASLKIGLRMREGGATEAELNAFSPSVRSVAFPAPAWDGKSKYNPRWAR